MIVWHAYGSTWACVSRRLDDPESMVHSSSEPIRLSMSSTGLSTTDQWSAQRTLRGLSLELDGGVVQPVLSRPPRARMNSLSQAG
jgi:hypothetical protein